MNLGPHDSFLNASDSPQQDHIIFNPPSSAPSVLHTPFKFLPKEDKRRNILSTHAAQKPSTTYLPPPIIQQKPGYQRHHLTEKDVEEMRRLKDSDPQGWTKHKLAKKFNCSSLFANIVCESTPEQKAYAKQKLEAAKEKWGPKRRAAREDRQKRRELWHRDE
jgi:hypothetical protein